MNPYRLAREILGSGNSDVFMLALSVGIMHTLVFTFDVPLPDINVSRDLCPFIAERFWGDPERLLEMMSAKSLALLRHGGLEPKYIGGEGCGSSRPKELLFYLAWYLEYGEPYFKPAA